MTPDGQQFELLADLGAMIAREVELDDLLAVFAQRVARAMAADRATLWLVDGAELRTGVANLPEGGELRLPAGRGLAGHVAASGETVNLADAAADPRWAPDIDRQTGYRTGSLLAVPVIGGEHVRGVVQILGKQGGPFTARDEEFARALADQIARALDYTSLRGDADRRGVTVRGRFNHVVGRSAAMLAVYDIVGRAAATDATVLVHGETGTGKGLLARAIHVNSPRQAAPLVAVDCTTLPAGLVESELFGHERGAFTGADARVIGKVEVAAGGTLFLDEIGELPLALQGKLLRFVQERRFERVGGRETLEADVRIVAATNRDLAAQVAAGQFRSDLYFRLRVVELALPPLRDRGDGDILSLAEHFAAVFARRYRRGDVRLADSARRALVRHRWPGNVRELEHAIERAVVLATGELIEADALALDAAPAGAGARGDGASISLPASLTLDAVERAWARAAVEREGGNQSAAARALGISRNKLARLLREVVQD